MEDASKASVLETKSSKGIVKVEAEHVKTSTGEEDNGTESAPSVRAPNAEVPAQPTEPTPDAGHAKRKVLTPLGIEAHKAPRPVSPDSIIKVVST